MSTGKRRRYGLALLVALALAGPGASYVAPVASASPSHQLSLTEKTITVGGDGEASAAPDVAYVSVGVQTQGATAAEATAENSRRMTAILDALRARGLGPRDLQTSGLTVSPQFQRDRPDVVTGYQASN